MRSKALIAALAALALSLGHAAEAQQSMYSLGDGGTSLIRYGSDSPGSATRVGLFGGDGFFLDSIDFRPSTGQLYGYSDADNSYYTVDLSTASLTRVGGGMGAAATSTPYLGIDWNPTIDRMRVVTENGENRVFNPNDGSAVAVTDLAYAGGDPNAGRLPYVIDNAYTNSPLGGSAGGMTTQYVLDSQWDTLATLANNAGTLTTVGNVRLASGDRLDFDRLTGFDIYTSPSGQDIAYALLTLNGSPGLYTIDLGSGIATPLGAINPALGGGIYGLAIVPTAVPEPGSLALMGLGLAGFSAAMARRRLAA